MFSTDEDKIQLAEDGDYYLMQKQTSAHPQSPSKSSSAVQLGCQLYFYTSDVLSLGITEIFWEIDLGQILWLFMFFLGGWGVTLATDRKNTFPDW